MDVERYLDKGGKAWVRIKFHDRYRTEVITPEPEFEKNMEKLNSMWHNGKWRKNYD